MEAVAATGFIDVFFAEDDGFGIGGQAVGVCGEIAAMITDCMEFGDIFGNGKESGHWTKGTSSEIHVETGNDDPMTAKSKRLAHSDQGVIEKLSFINTNDIDGR